jgi:hypothetical protein
MNKIYKTLGLIILASTLMSAPAYAGGYVTIQIIGPINDGGGGGNAPSIVEKCAANALSGRTCFG